MGFDYQLLPPIFLAIVGCVVMVMFFSYYGAFKHPWYYFLTIFITICIAIFETFALLPYDTALCLFGSTKEQNDTLYNMLTILYWISWFFGWIITPLLTCVYTYNFGMTWGHRIWYAIRYNIYWYLIAALVAAAGIGVLWASGKLQLSNLIPLVMALSNAYGLLLLCLLFGFGFIDLPRSLWKLADSNISLRRHLININNESKELSQVLTDGKILLTATENAETKVHKLYRDKFMENLQPRVKKLKDILNQTLYLNEALFPRTEPSKAGVRVRDFDWSRAYTNQLEMFLKDTDRIISKLKIAISYLQNSVSKAEKAMKTQKSKAQHLTRLILMRILSVIVGILCAISFWGETTIMFKPEWSVFHIISHLQVPKWVSEVLVTAPIIFFLCFVGTYSLTKVRIGNYFRFIKGGSSEYTFYYFAIILVRLAPTIGYHYLMQLGCDNSMTMAVFLKTKEVLFFGDYWTVFSPILMIIIGLLVLFNVWDTILFALGIKKFTYDNSLSQTTAPEERRGREILLDIKPDLSVYGEERSLLISDQSLYV